MYTAAFVPRMVFGEEKIVPYKKPHSSIGKGLWGNFDLVNYTRLTLRYIRLSTNENL